jgi:hypothetical protein
MATPSAVGAYRALMRARAKAFAGDARALDAAHREIRTQFERARDVDANDARAKIAAAVEAATFVRTHVVQAVREGDEGAFRMTVDAEHQDVTISRDGEGEKGCGGGGRGRVSARATSSARRDADARRRRRARKARLRV